MATCAFSGVNFVRNPGFENDSDADSVPDFWYVKSDPSSLLKIEPNGKKGKCVSILGKGVYSSVLRKLKKNRFYILSFWIKRDGWREGEYPKIEIFNRVFYLNTVIGWGDWIRIFLLLNSGNNSRTILSLINPGLHHKLYFDEISLKEFSPVPLSPRGEIYTCWPEFVWSIPENPYILQIRIEISRYADFREFFVVKHKTAPEKNILLPDFPIDGGRWFWRIRLYKNKRLIATSRAISFNISAFFPIGIYGVPLKYIGVIKKAGFNSICAGADFASMRELLSAVSNHGLKVLISPRIREKGFYKSIKSMCYSPHILGWYLEDEPEIRHLYPSYIWRLRQYIKAMDPSHPSLITLVRADTAEDYGECADIIMVDPYPIPRRPITWLSESIDKVKKLFPYKPVWAVIQAFDWSAFPYGEEDREWGRDPTYEEERCLTYLAIIHGARGLFYYTFKSGNYFIMERKKHWQDVKKVINELNSIYHALVSPTVFPVGSPARSKDGAVHYIIKEAKDGYYLLSVNTKPYPKDVVLRLPRFCSNAKAKEIFRKEELTVNSKGLLNLHFSPYQARVYLISGAH